MALDHQYPLVVVVEDDPDTRELYRLVLESVGYCVATAGSVASASAAFRRVIPDVVLSDWLLPDGDGSAVCEALSAQAATRWVPAVVLSGLELPADAEAQARQKGLAAVLLKPSDPDAILNAIAEALLVGVDRRVRAAAVRTKRYAGQLHRRAPQLRVGAANTRDDASALLTRAAARSGASICLMIADDHAHYVAAGGATRELTGYDLAELTSLTVSDLTGIAMTPEFQGLWTRFITEGRQEGCCTLRRRDGEPIDARYCALANIAPGWHVSALAEMPAMPVSLGSI